MIVRQGKLPCLLNNLQFGQQIIIAVEHDSHPASEMIAEPACGAAQIGQINAAVREQEMLQALRSL
ncbi:hypothetical protein D3C81_2250520 [compost metagenome]